MCLLFRRKRIPKNLFMRNMFSRWWWLPACIAMISVSCSIETSTLPGVYRGILESDGGELAFPLHIREQGDMLEAFVVNGADTVRFTSVTVYGDSLRLSFDHYDAHLQAKINADGSLTGRWDRRASGGKRSRLPFHAKPGLSYRYPPSDVDHHDFDGEWRVTFTDDDGSFPAQGLFVTEPGGRLHGTFRKETGDYRFLEGFYTDSALTLSTFDGAHAFLFKARLQPDGTLKGDFWSRDTYHATWTAQKGESRLRDPLEISAAEAVGKKMEFQFPDIDGNPVSTDHSRFENKPMLVYLFGSWCPNCSDETRLIKELYMENYRDTDLQIVGLAYEFTGNFKRDAEMVRKYKQQFEVPWTLLVAGTSDKKKAADTLPFIDTIISFPTSFFVNRNHNIEAVHVGFNGPATGSAYFKEIQRFKNNLHAITIEKTE